MKTVLGFLAIFCLIIGAFLSLTSTSEYLANFTLFWGIGSCLIFGILAIFFPE